MSLPRRAFFAIAVGLVAACANADDPATNGTTITTTAGKKLTGRLVGVDALGVTFATSDAKVTIPGKDLVLVDLGHKIAVPPKGVKFHELELTDGSTFRIAKFSIKGRKVEFELLPGPAGVPAPTTALDLGSVFSVMLGADDPKNHDAWKKMLATRGKRDLYVLREADGLNFLQGTILSGNDAGDVLNFEKEDATRAELRLSRATGGLVFAQPQPPRVPTTLCKVLDVFGNLLVAQSLEIGQSGTTVTTVSGVVVQYPSPTAIAQLNYVQANVAYLSDLDLQVDAPPPPADEKGFRLNVVPPVIRDRGVSNEILKLAGNEVFPKGLSIAPDTVVTFNVGGDYRELKALIGLSENSPDANLEAKVTIEGDGQPLFSESIRRKDKPKSIGLDVKGVKQIRVIVESAQPVFGNRVILADARVQK